jgi:hypothetical protein
MDLEADAKIFLSDLKKSKRLVAQVSTKDGQVNSKELRGKIETLSKEWFSKFKIKLVNDYGFDEANDSIKRRCESFTHLLHLSANHGNKKALYLKDLNSVLNKFQLEIINPLQTGTPSNITPIEGAFDNLLKSLTNEQNEYLTEALNCTKAGYLKASVVLGWCACIDQIHQKIESLGYPTFNVASAKLASQKVGKFKHFNTVCNIASISELREVSDKHVLIVLEGIGIIDSNQGTRLKSCLEMRNHSGHPGEAPITSYNVMSFFSDIGEIVLLNPKFNPAVASQSSQS